MYSIWFPKIVIDENNSDVSIECTPECFGRFELNVIVCELVD